MLTIYRRHLKSCEHKDEGRKYRRCRCPIWADGILSGEDLRCSLSTRDWDSAQTTIRKWETEGRGPMPGAAPEDAPITVAEACANFIADAEARNLRKATIKKYRQLERELQAYALFRRFRALREIGVPELVQFRGGWKNKNIGALKKLERLRCFFRFARDNGWIPENPAEKIKNPRVAPNPTLPFTQDEMKRILEAIGLRLAKVKPAGRDNVKRLFALVLLLRYSGLRINDAMSCSVDRLVDGKIRLYTQKTGTHVHCPLPEFVVRALDCLPRTSEAYWFWNGQGTRTVALWQKRLHKLFIAAGITGGHAHRFRDTFAVDLLLSGVPMERVAVMLGHQSVKITEKHYSPWVRERQEQAEADVRRSWSRDPLVLMFNDESGETKGTHEVHENAPRIM